MLEYIFLLLPIAALSGWIVARRSYINKGNKSINVLSREYFTGLNYLLNEQPDKAIEVFIRMVEVDSETVETHLALGNLFRRRGEVDRAIRIHQNIIARPTLNKKQRSQALYELGLDYMSAGLLDRAENLFNELLETGEYNAEALSQLIEIYEGEKDWEHATECTRKLEKESNINLHNIISQYFCEMAEEECNKRNYSSAKQHLKKALQMDHNNVRATIMTGEIEELDNDFKSAVKTYKRVENQNPDYVSEIIPPLKRCYEKLERVEELETYLEELTNKYDSISPVLALVEQLRQREGDKKATEILINKMKNIPSVKGLEYLIEMNMEKAEGKGRDNLIILSDIVKKILEDRPIYKCSECGYKVKTMHWHCPSCKNWSCIKPIHGVAGD